MNYAMGIADDSAKGARANRPVSFVPALQDYGIFIKLLTKFLDGILKISNTHYIIVTAHILERENATTKEIELLPNIIGRRFPSSLGLWFNEVWNISLTPSKDKKIQRALTVSTESFKCKTQTPNMPLKPIAENALRASLGIPMVKQK